MGINLPSKKEILVMRGRIWKSFMKSVFFVVGSACLAFAWYFNFKLDNLSHFRSIVSTRLGQMTSSYKDWGMKQQHTIAMIQAIRNLRADTLPEDYKNLIMTAKNEELQLIDVIQAGYVADATILDPKVADYNVSRADDSLTLIVQRGDLIALATGTGLLKKQMAKEYDNSLKNVMNMLEKVDLAEPKYKFWAIFFLIAGTVLINFNKIIDGTRKTKKED